MGDRHRWVDLSFTTLTIGVLSLFGKYYHRWGLGVVAAVSVVALREGVYRVSGRWEKWRRAKRAASEHAVVVHLDGTGLPADVYKQYDLDTIETELRSIMDGQWLGEYDGNEIGEAGATLFMYGPDGDHLFTGIEAALRAYPLCRNARVLIRPGPPGTPAREVRL